MQVSSFWLLHAVVPFTERNNFIRFAGNIKMYLQVFCTQNYFKISALGLSLYFQNCRRNIAIKYIFIRKRVYSTENRLILDYLFRYFLNLSGIYTVGFYWLSFKWESCGAWMHNTIWEQNWEKHCLVQLQSNSTSCIATHGTSCSLTF